MKGKTDGNKGITYLDLYDVTKVKHTVFDMFLSKEYDRENRTGEGFYNFSVNGSVIYTIVKTINGLHGDSSWAVETYDGNGDHISSLKLDEKIADLIKDEHIAKFEVYGEYGFIRTFSGGGVVFRISADEIVPELLIETYLDIAAPARNDDVQTVILYSRGTGEIWKLDIFNHRLFKINLPYDSLRNIFIDGNKAMITSDYSIYADLERIPVENRNLLEQ